MKFSVFQLSRIGGRQRNEDRMGYAYTRESGLFLLADGMGGHPDGDIAAQLALESMSQYYQQHANPRIENVATFMEEVVLVAHRHILSYATRRGMVDTPRTTVVAAVVQDNAVTFAHCGDSRAYFIRNKALLTRTRDHSYIEQQNAGNIKLNMANRNILFTCLGSPTRPIFDISQAIPLQSGDRVFLCSDGLWGPLDDETIVSRIRSGLLATAMSDLIDLALHEGGERCDNTTVVGFDWEAGEGGDTIVTDSVNQGVFSTSIHSSGAHLEEIHHDDLDDEAIEESIAEINAAIAKAAATRKKN